MEAEHIMVTEDNDFETIRRKNIEELQLMFQSQGIQEAVQDLADHIKQVSAKKNKVSLKRKRAAPRQLKFDWDYEPRKSSRISAIGPIDYKGLDFGEEGESKKAKQRFSLKVNLKQRKTSFPKPIEELVDYSDFNDWLLGGKVQFCGFYKVDQNNSYELKEILRDFNKEPEFVEVTESMLKRITYKSTSKVYDKELGTSCHQCRQKTLDTKSFCRWPLCSGVRGQFCGFCLKKRYGEDLRDILRNPEWKCPPCRAICNCSICRNRQGKEPTGILSHVAEGKGFESVHHLLEHEGKEENGPKSDVSVSNFAMKKFVENQRIQVSASVERLKAVVAGLEEYAKTNMPEETLTQPTEADPTTEESQLNKLALDKCD